MSQPGGAIDWRPDEVIPQAVADGRLKGSRLSPEDERWAVAALSEKGWSVNEIASRLERTPRHIKRLRAELAVQVMRLLAAEMELTATLHSFLNVR